MLKTIKEFRNALSSLTFWKRSTSRRRNCESLTEIKPFHDVVDYACKGLGIVGDNLAIYSSSF